MTRTLFIFLSTLLLVSNINAQNLDVEGMAIFNGGNVGIGTGSPTRQLHVRSGVNTSIPMRIESQDLTSATIDFKDPTTTADWQARIGGKGDGLVFIAGGGERMNILDNGNVGIGIDNPQRRLHAKAGVEVGIVARMESEHIDGATIEFQDPNTTAPWQARIGGKGDGLIFIAGAWERMSILDNGDVGIGTTAPEKQLHLRGDGFIKLEDTGTPEGDFAELNVTPGGVFRLYKHSTNENGGINILSSGNVGIGTSSPIEKLEVRNDDDDSYTHSVIRNEGNGGTSLWLYNGNNSTGSSKVIFRNSNSDNTTSQYWAIGNDKTDGNKFKIHPNTDMEGESTFIIDRDGDVGIGTSTATAKLDIYRPSPGTGIEVDISALNSPLNSFGVHSEIVGTGDGNVYAIYGGISHGGMGDAYAGYFAGHLAYTGTLSNVSDRKFKKNIKDFTVLEKVLQLEPKTYELKADKYPHMGFSDKKEYGFIAQELQAVFPSLVLENVNVFTDNSGKLKEEQTKEERYLGISYIELIPILTKAIQEQQTIIEEQQSENQTLKSDYKNLEIELQQLKDLVYQLSDKLSNHRENIGNSQQILEFTAIPQLNQNVPNPFNQTTTIDYFIPKTAQSAQLQMTNLRGQVIQTRTLQVGKGQVTLHQKDLADGTYAYSLIIDGKVIDTKQMILTK